MSGPCWAMLGVYGAYVGPMLVHVRLLEAMLVPSSGHVELMLSQEQLVPFKSSNVEGVMRWKLAVGHRFPLGLGFRGLAKSPVREIDRARYFA